MAMAIPSLMRVVESDFKDEEYSDMKVICRDSVFYVHKMILCTQSEFFKTAFRIDMKEKAESEITLNEYKPSVVHSMLKFLYTGEYDDTAGIANDRLRPIRLNALVYAAAVEYQIEPLQIRARKKFASAAKCEWSNDEFRDFLAAVDVAYKSVPAEDAEAPGLRKTLVTSLLDHGPDALGSGTQSLFFIETKPEFTADVLSALARQHEHDDGSESEDEEEAEDALVSKLEDLRERRRQREMHATEMERSLRSKIDHCRKRRIMKERECEERQRELERKQFRGISKRNRY